MLHGQDLRGGGGVVARVLKCYETSVYTKSLIYDSYSHGKISNMYVERPKLKLSNKKLGL